MSVIERFLSWPWPLQLTAGCLTAAVLLASTVWLLEKPWRHESPAERRQRERADLGLSKPARQRPAQADQPGTADLPETEAHPAPRKLPGQDRLTRDGPAPAQQPAPPLRRGDPELAAAEPTEQLRSVRPPVPLGGPAGARARGSGGERPSPPPLDSQDHPQDHPQDLQDPSPAPDPSPRDDTVIRGPRQPAQRPADAPAPFPGSNHPRETRAERRERLRAEGRWPG